MIKPLFTFMKRKQGVIFLRYISPNSFLKKTHRGKFLVESNVSLTSMCKICRKHWRDFLFILHSLKNECYRHNEEGIEKMHAEV